MTKCRFRDQAEKQLLEQLIVGTKYKKVQGRLLVKGEQLTFNKAIDVPRTYEATVSQLEQLDSEYNREIHGFKGKRNTNDNKPKKCPNCGLKHPLQPRDRCPAYGSRCLNCNKGNHWAKVFHSNYQGGTRGRGTEETLHRIHAPTA